MQKSFSDPDTLRVSLKKEASITVLRRAGLVQRALAPRGDLSLA